MSYTITGANLYAEIMYHLLETPVDGSSEPVSGLYTRAEVMARLNLKAYEYAKQTGVLATDGAATTTTDTTAVNLVTNTIDVLQVSQGASAATYLVVPKGSSLDAELFILDISTSTATPTIWVMDTAGVQTLHLLPPPSSAVASATGAFITYVQRPTALPTTPDSTVLNLPNDLTPFVKYGALADLFGKAGETYDPQRQAICQQLFEMGVDIGRHWVSGAQS